MARLLRVCVQEIILFIDDVSHSFRRWPPPHGFTPCLVGTESSFPLSELVPRNQNEISNSPSKRLSELLGVDLSVLWGVPVSKRTRATKKHRQHSAHRLFAPKRNLVACQHCGEWHEIHTICGECYKKVREETEVIKKRLLAYNPFKGELPDKETIVVYQGEKPPDDKEIFGSEQRIIEVDKPRPSWFSADLKKRWQNLKPFVYKKPLE